MLHQYLSSSCEFVQAVDLRDHGKYASVEIPGVANEVYSPELGNDDFLALSDVSTKVVKTARKSGFRVKLAHDTEDHSPRVLMKSASSQCPNLKDATQTTAQERSQRRRQVQSKLHRPGFDSVTPPSALSSPPPDPNQGNKRAISSSAVAGTKPKRQGTVILAVVVDVDGNVPEVKVVRSVTTELDQKAVEAVRKWKFEPARKNGLPVPVLINVEVNFRLY